MFRKVPRALVKEAGVCWSQGTNSSAHHPPGPWKAGLGGDRASCGSVGRGQSPTIRQVPVWVAAIL